MLTCDLYLDMLSGMGRCVVCAANEGYVLWDLATRLSPSSEVDWVKEMKTSAFYYLFSFPRIEKWAEFRIAS